MSGRPSKLTPELQERICEYIAKGHTYNRACKLCNISVSVFCEWRSKGEQARSKGETDVYTEFMEAVELADVQYIEVYVNCVHDAVKDGDAKLALTILGRKLPEEFGRRDNIVLEHKLDSDTDLSKFLKVIYGDSPTSKENDIDN